MMDNNIIQQQSVSLDKPFEPDEEMILWIDTAIELRTSEKTRIAEACGIDRTKFYKTWKKKPGFMKWYLEAWSKGIREYGPELDAIGMSMARRDYNFWKSMQQRVGNLQEKGNQTNIQINNLPGLDIEK